MTNFDDYKLAIETMSGGKNTVILDDVGMPSVVVPFPKLTYADIMTGGTQEVLPAFIVDGVEQDAIYESKFQNIVMNDRAYSLPLKDPAVDITFDRALTVCRNKGTGWHLHTNALWAAIQNWCYKNNTVPHGNSLYGKDANHNHEHGIPTYKYDSSGVETVGRTATGSGPKTWYHNYTGTGIADLCGNVWEWVAGFRLVNGEIQIIPYGNAMKFDCNMSLTSTEWKAIKSDGTLVAPGTAGTLKYDGEIATSGIRINTEIEFSTGNTYFSKAFGSIAAKAGVTVPQMLKGLGIAPIPDFTYGNGMLHANNNDPERMPFRGANWSYGSYAGVAALNLNFARTYSNYNFGFRSAYFGKL